MTTEKVTKLASLPGRTRLQKWLKIGVDLEDYGQRTGSWLILWKAGGTFSLQTVDAQWKRETGAIEVASGRCSL